MNVHRVLYLQYGDETKQLRMPNEITSADTIRALFVSAFPQQLTMKMLESPSVAIYIKDESRNVYYELNDVRNIQDRSLLKVYNKDPAHAFNHTPKTMNGDLRVGIFFSFFDECGCIAIKGQEALLSPASGAQLHNQLPMVENRNREQSKDQLL
ncbi:hypothetical protein H8959_011467 [Pygathrix nigripes]